ncbi:hypothetical protein LRS11_16035 [Pseudomonas sp. J452]|uniref:hypothetical protein n=1 Tax=Pseudomonas sp. J452 TaxID=2898441 RepID=UPI0021AE1164|nr:hypothetical protein [Pseudomonas sp. J452]UUY07323.1 hypothetical protein LRS11_16035 [Pseudomonas sp. J452]
MNGLALARYLLLGVGLGLGLPALAQQVVINSNSSLPQDSQQYQSDDVIVDGVILTLSGATRFGTLTLRNNARITSATGSVLSVSASSVSIDASSRIDVSANGNGPNTASTTNYYAGGSYGGRGGGYNGTYYSPGTYGDFRLPRSLGTGGRYNNDASPFTRGGGALELVAENLNLDGQLLANGQAITGSTYGSGSGGSVLVQVGSLNLGAQALIRADGGGHASSQTYGGGGGGRVAVYYAQLAQGSLEGRLSARGGLSTQAEHGSAGSIYLKNTQSGNEELLFDNSGVTGNAVSSYLDLSTGPAFAGTLRFINASASLQGELAYDASLTAQRSLHLKGATLYLAGEQAFSQISLQSATLTTSSFAALKLRADQISVDASSKIDVSAKGNGPNTASTTNYWVGGSYGGSGGGYNGTYYALPTRGDYRLPRDLGSGGRQGSSTSNWTRGGGAVELQAESLSLDGQILANGQTITGSSYGSGSGGAVLLQVGSLSLGAQALIRADGGGHATLQTYGGGGGGRVALHYRELAQGSLEGRLSARGGISTQAQHGGAGSVYLKSTQSGSEELLFDNSGVPVTNVPSSYLNLLAGPAFVGPLRFINANASMGGELAYDAGLTAQRSLHLSGGSLSLTGEQAFQQVVLQQSAVLSSQTGTALKLRAEQVSVDASSKIDVSARGKGPITGWTTNHYAGGSYGGRGGAYSNYYSQATYGDFRLPRDLGTGGRHSSSTSNWTLGGGALELQAESLSLDGQILANGQTITGSVYGSGSGGAVLLQVGSLSLGAQALIRADGGGHATLQTYGGGGGGRVALHYRQLVQGTLDGRLTARGGLSTHAQAGGAGSVYLKNTQSGSEELLFDNSSVPTTNAASSDLNLSTGSAFAGPLRFVNANASLNGGLVYDAVLTAKRSLHLSGGSLSLAGEQAFAQVSLQSATLTTPFSAVLKLRAEQISIDVSSKIDVSEKGNGPNTTWTTNHYAGGSYGGRGGAYSNYYSPATYGDFRLPRDLGTGGRHSSSTSNWTRGGGAVELQAESLSLDGQILANGQAITGSVYGSGSGGAVLLQVGSLSLGAQALIRADGGGHATGQTYGGGGGGRVALHYRQLEQGSLDGRLTARGGLSTHAQAGGAGSVYLKNTQSGSEELLFDNSGVPTTNASSSYLDLRTGPAFAGPLRFVNANASLSGELTYDEQATPNLELVLQAANLTLANGKHSLQRIRLLQASVLNTYVGAATPLSVSADSIEVSADSKINASEQGDLPSLAVATYSGGSHGGLGGRYNNTASVNPTFGDPLRPITRGIGGSSNSSSYYTRGGGALFLSSRVLDLQGQLLANGGVPLTGSNAGGGAGGSIWVNTQLLRGGAGSRIHARGGDARGVGGAGGGGRIALYYGQLESFDPLSQLSVAPGAGVYPAGVGSLHLENHAGAVVVQGSTLSELSKKAFDNFTLDFSTPIDATSLNAQTLQLQGPEGAIVPVQFNVLSPVTYRVRLPQMLTDGVYELRLAGVRSAQGLGMDQNGNGTEDEADDFFFKRFEVDLTAPAAPQVTAPLVAPAINQLNVRQVTLKGTRVERSAILVNDVVNVDLGEGAWTVSNYPLPEGTSSLKLQVRDAAGNLSEAVMLNFSIDSTAPTVSSYYPNYTLSRWAPSKVTVTFTETGTGLDLGNSYLTLMKGNLGIAGSLALENNTLTLIPGSSLLEGTYTAYYRLQDKAGNQKVSSFSFTQDYTAPAAVVLNAYPATTTNSKVTLSGTRENGATVYIYDGAGAPLTSICCSGSTWGYTATLLPGDNRLSFRQYDQAGNYSPLSEALIRFDNQAPGPVSILADPKGSGTEVKLSWSGYNEADNGNDIQQYRVYSAAAAFSNIAQAQQVANTNAGIKQITLKNLPRDQQAFFAVVAVDKQGLLNPQVQAVAATPDDVQAPEIPVSLQVETGAEHLLLNWQASANAAGDLKGYRLYVGAADEQVIELPLSELGAGLSYRLTGLQPASANPLRLVAVDNDGNQSAGLSNPGITWLNNPQDLQLTAFSSRFEASWQAVTPAPWIAGYRLYVADAPFTSVQGMQPRLSLQPGQLSGQVAGLENNKAYHVAVTVLNASSGENPQVQSQSITPEADSTGPELLQVLWRGPQGDQDLAEDDELRQLGELRLRAKDESGIGRIEVSLAGQSLGQMQPAGSDYRLPWDISQLADDDYSLSFKLYDTLDNLSEVSQAVEVDLLAPGAPQISLQSKASSTNQAQQVLLVTGQPLARARVQLNGQSLTEDLALSAQGEAQWPLTLQEGDNTLQAAVRFATRQDYGDDSQSLSVVLDSSLPNAPTGLQAQAKAQGQVQLSWSAVNNVKGYNLYVSAQPFSALEQAGVSKINTGVLSAPSYSHKPTNDGTYYYRVAAVNALGSESNLSGQQSAVADRVAPKVEEALYSSEGVVAADGRHAPGRIEVSLRFSEALRNAPFFSMDVPEGASIPVRMAQVANDPLQYRGSFDLTASVPADLLYARLSAYDAVGNEGTEVAIGNTLRADTRGPDVVQLSLLPESPIENLVANNQGREMQVILRLSDEPVTTPELKPLLNGEALSSQPGAISLSKDGQSQPGAPVYTGMFRLPVGAGQGQIDLLSFAYQASDDLGNLSQHIAGSREFQVYQGQLPPLAVPDGLTGKALPGGRVALSWRAVSNAGVYQLYRRADADAQFVPLARVRGLSFEDNLPESGLGDGTYHYQLTSIREHESKEAESLPSAPARVVVDSTAPGAPREVQIELNGAGVVLRWLAPQEPGTYTYNLYRTSAAAQPVDLSGQTPLQTKIPELIALDSKPSDSARGYTLTAVDAAGNESPPADVVQLQVELLPVSDLRINLPVEGAPSLSWEHTGEDVEGFNIYLGAEGSRQKLNSSLVSAKTWQDQGASLPLSAERLYSVTAVDSNGVESMPHSLTLPLLSTALRPGQEFKRGLFNQLFFQVGNNGSQAFKGLRLQVLVQVNGSYLTHQSEAFDVPAGGLSEVPVVVAGHPSLPGVVPLQLTITHAPQPGEQVTLRSNASVDAGDTALLAQVQADTLTRGAVGSVRVRLENPSKVPVDLVTARNGGRDASSELRLILEDLQGNVLASQSAKVAVGNGLVMVSDGRTVARVGAGEALEVGPFNISVPGAAPEQVRVRLVADKLHYLTGQSGELTLPGLSASRELTLSDTPYVGELISIEPAQVEAGDSVVIRGRALKRDTQEPLADVGLKVLLNVRGFEETVHVTTDAEGQFSYQRKTRSTDSGVHQVSVIHPALTTRPVHGSFTVSGASFSPASVNTQFPRNYEQLVTIVVEAGHDTVLNNLRLEYVKPAGSNGLPAGIKVLTSPPMNLAAQKRGNLTLRISGDNSAAASGLLDYRVVADGLSKPIGQTRIQYSLVAPQPVINVSPNQIRTGLKRGGEEQVESISLKNTGMDVLRNVRLSLLNSEGGALPAWVSLRSAERPGDLAAGSAVPLSVAFKPGEAVAEGNYYVTLRIQSDNHPQVDIAMEAAVTQSGEGGVIFQASDIYTGTRDDNGQLIPGLAGAKIKLQNRNVLSVEYSVTTDSRGQALLENIPAGEYTYRVSAWDHDDLSGQLWIKPGMTQAEQVFLMSKLVTVEWSVKEITLEDRYEVILDATFKTNVPTALVMIEPLSINLPAMRKGDVLQGELELTNYGLVRADNVQANLPAGDARAKIEYLRPVPSTLNAGDVVVIPYRVLALQSFDPEDVLNGAAGCWNFSYPVNVKYSSQCANGTVVNGQASTAFTSNGSTGSCGGGSGGGVGGGGGATGGGAGGWGGWGGGGTGGGISVIPKPVPTGTAQQCVPPTDCESGNCPGANGGGK